jgi:pimeloyl-ACP methyl ester carboxylesterase
MRSRIVLGTAGGTALVAFGLAGAAGCAIARALTAPYTGRRYSTRVLGIVTHGDQQMALMEETAQTGQAGRYGAFLPGGGLIRFGTDVVATGSGVTRSVSAPSDALAGVEYVSWTGVEFATPADAGLDGVDISIESENGPIPAWVIGDGTSATWALHIHGLGSTRAGTLRGVQVASELGLTSIVSAYRNSAEGPGVGSRRSTLGIDESRDVERAMKYASDHGAKRIVLFGWSMGANIALRLAHQSPWRHRIIAIVAESPVLDWRATLKENLTGYGLPAWTASLAYPWLSLPPLARRIGLDHGIDLDALDWTAHGRIHTPTLIMQGRDDRSTPWQLAERVADRSRQVHVELFEADHTMTWNSDPDRWRSVVKDWLTPRLDQSADQEMP